MIVVAYSSLLTVIPFLTPGLFLSIAVMMRRRVSPMLPLLLLAHSFCRSTGVAAWSSFAFLLQHDPQRTPDTALQASTKPREGVAVTGNVTILDRGPHHVVVAKPPSVVCHHSGWTGSRAGVDQQRLPEIPMLQRVRNALGQRINLVHRLDRGASGCLLCTFTNDNEMEDATKVLIDAMSNANKTYIALVRGEGILHGEELKTKGWFPITRPIKDERGALNNATTFFRFVAGQDNGQGTINRARASLVLARPQTGRWHQIRRHLNGLSHPILGDSSHGSSRENREWRKRGMPGERLCLHLVELKLPRTCACPDGIHASCPLPEDMMEMLKLHLPDVLQEAQPILEQEGIHLHQETNETLPFRVVA